MQSLLLVLNLGVKSLWQCVGEGDVCTALIITVS